MEKNLKKNTYVGVCVYIYIYVSTYNNHFAGHLKLTQHCKALYFNLKIKMKEFFYVIDVNKQI